MRKIKEEWNLFLKQMYKVKKLETIYMIDIEIFLGGYIYDRYVLFPMPADSRK